MVADRLAPARLCGATVQLADEIGQRLQLTIEPGLEFRRILRDLALGVLQRLRARNAAGASRHLLEASVDEENAGVAVGFVLHQSCPVRAALNRLSMSSCAKAGPTSAATSTALSPLRRPTPPG